MFDRITLGSQRASIKPWAMERAKISIGPSKAYGRWRAIEIDGLEIMFSNARRDMENNSPKSNLLIAFNGFDAGSYSRATELIQSIIDNDCVENFSIDKLECALDIRASAATLQTQLDLASVKTTQYFDRKCRNPWLYREKVGTKSHTIAFGNPNHYQLKVYDKSRERKKRVDLTPAERKTLGQITRLEITYGRSNVRIGRSRWRDLYDWLVKVQPFSEVGWFELPPMLNQETAIYSVDGLFLRGLHSLIHSGIAIKTIVQRFKARQPWEGKYLSEQYQASQQSVERPIFQRMFYTSSRRFFESRAGPIEAMIWQFDGSSFDLVPHILMRGRNKHLNRKKTNEQ